MFHKKLTKMIFFFQKFVREDSEVKKLHKETLNESRSAFQL